MNKYKEWHIETFIFLSFYSIHISTSEELTKTYIEDENLTLKKKEYHSKITAVFHHVDSNINVFLFLAISEHMKILSGLLHHIADISQLFSYAIHDDPINGCRNITNFCLFWCHQENTEFISFCRLSTSSVIL